VRQNGGLKRNRNISVPGATPFKKYYIKMLFQMKHSMERRKEDRAKEGFLAFLRAIQNRCSGAMLKKKRL
jgi:hypothetical protein